MIQRSDLVVGGAGDLCCKRCGASLASLRGGDLAGVEAAVERALKEHECVPLSPAEERIKKAMAAIERYGGFEGAHHKQWVIDQVVRILLGAEGYTRWLEEMNDDPEGYEPWDQGIAP